MFPTGNSSGNGPQAYGSAPMPFEAMSAANNKQSSMQLMQWAAMTDPSVQTATRLTTDAILNGSWGRSQDYYAYKGNSLSDFSSSTAGQAIQAGWTALALNSGFGGSIGQMAMGIQQMMGSGGFRAGDAGVFRGAGFVTDQSSALVIDQLRDHFFDPTSGMGNYRARGLSKGDFGELGFAMARRGMFAGMDLGNPMMDADTGMLGFSDSSGAMTKLKEKFEQAAAMVSQFRDVFGQGAPASQMVAEAERLTGMSFNEAGAQTAAMSKLGHLKTLSAINGMDLQQMLGMDSAMQAGTAHYMANLYGGSAGDYGRIAAAATSNIWGVGLTASANRAEAMNLAKERGLPFMRNFSQDQIMTLSMVGQSRIMGEEWLAAEALFAADNNNMDPAIADNIRSTVAQLGSAGDSGTRQRLRSQLSQQMTQAGLTPGALMRRYGGDLSAITGAMSQSSLQMFTDMSFAQDQARMMSSSMSGLLRTHNFASRYGLKGSGAFGTLFGTLSDEAIMGTGGVADLLNSGNEEGLLDLFGRDDIVAAFGGDKKAASDFAKQLIATNGQTGGRLGTAVSEAWSLMQNDPMFANRVSTMDRQLNTQQMTNKRIMSKAFGNQQMSNLNLFEQMAKGFFGEGEITDSAVLDYLTGSMKEGRAFKGAVQSYNISTSGASLTQDQLSALNKQTGGALADALGMEIDANGKITNFDQVSKKLSTQGGVSSLISALDASGTAWDVTSKNGDNMTLRVGDLDAARKAGISLDKMNRAVAAGALSGKKFTEEELKELGKLTDKDFDKQIGALKEESLSGLMSSDKELDKLISRISSGDTQALQALQDSGGMEAIRTRMQERVSELSEKGGKKNKKTLSEYRDAAAQMDGQQEFLGRIELIMDDRMSGSLFSKG